MILITTRLHENNGPRVICEQCSSRLARCIRAVWCESYTVCNTWSLFVCIVAEPCAIINDASPEKRYRYLWILSAIVKLTVSLSNKRKVKL